MPHLLELGSAWLETERTAHLSRPVVYARGAETVVVSASVGRTIFRIENAYGVQERHEARDYLILASALFLGGALELPKAGDRIREEEDGKVFVYEVMAPGGEPCWRYSDPYRRTLRIHTKHVGTEVNP